MSTCLGSVGTHSPAGRARRWPKLTDGDWISSNANRRRDFGSQNVGIPANEIRLAIERLKANDNYDKIRFDAVGFYTDRLLFRELVGLIDETLSIDQLKTLEPEIVKISFILLLRDMMQQHRAHIVIDPALDRFDTVRIEQFTAGLIFECRARDEPYMDWLDRIKDVDQEPTPVLVAGVANQLGLDVVELMQYHSAATELVGEVVLGVSDES